jgi:hypothetical protein
MVEAYKKVDSRLETSKGYHEPLSLHPRWEKAPPSAKNQGSY